MEHTILARYLGSEYLVIIVNKMDECDWSLERFEYIKKNLLPFLKDVCAYDIENQIYWVPIDGLGGANIQTPVNKERCPWYYGKPTLLEILDSLPKIQRKQINVLRIPIFDKLKERGDTFIHGKIITGAIKDSMNAIIMPSNKEIQIQKIFDPEDNPLTLAMTGDNVKLQVKNINDIEDIKRGNVICG